MKTAKFHNFLKTNAILDDKELSSMKVKRKIAVQAQTNKMREQETSCLPCIHLGTLLQNVEMSIFELKKVQHKG